MNKNKRWELAQNYEHEWWKKKTQQVKPGYYIHSADEIRKYFLEYKPLQKDTTILEIGSGATGILTFLNESNQRYAIDPLETYYATVEAFVKLRDKTVRYSANKGEELPFNDNMFDLLIVDNVLDHCENPSQVLSEIKRVLKEDGLVYFRQNTYNFYGKTIRAIMEFFLIDRGHPFTFTKSGLSRFFQQYDFEILKSKSNGYFDTWKGEITSGNAKNMIKALLFVTRDRLTVLLKNH